MIKSSWAVAHLLMMHLNPVVVGIVILKRICEEDFCCLSILPGIYNMLVSNMIWDSQYAQKSVLEKLIFHFLDIKREDLWIEDRELDDVMTEKIMIAYHKYVDEKQPLEYILGYVEFLGNKFKVDWRTLIPRPETEYMIQAVNEEIQTKTWGQNLLLDIGTWSWVLWISVLAHNTNFFSDAFLAEYYDNTITLAKENLEGYMPKLWDTKSQVVKSDLLQFMDPANNTELNKYNNIILVANLPYIPDETFDENVWDNVKNREPRPAFVWWQDWLDFYRTMFWQLFLLQKNNSNLNKSYVMFLEMMTRQVDILRKEFGEKLKFEEVKTFHFNIRIVKAALI
jgi:release factor glutamine methyltransferase